MAFQTITSQEIQSGSPIDSGLLLKVKNNDDYLDAYDLSQDSSIATLNTSLQNQINSLLSIVNAVDDTLVGSTIYTLKNTAPRGYISAMGVSIGKTSGTYFGENYYNLYTTLWDYASITAGQPYIISSTKGSTALIDWNAGKTITIDERGFFIRASGGNSNGVGTGQGDAIRNITATLGSDLVVGSAGAGYHGTQSHGVGAGGYSSNWLYFDASRQVPTAAENRPINIAKYVFIRYSNKLIP